MNLIWKDSDRVGKGVRERGIEREGKFKIKMVVKEEDWKVKEFNYLPTPHPYLHPTLTPQNIQFG